MRQPAVLFDTGPLLCFAAIPTGAALLKERYVAVGHTTEHVWSELGGLRRNTNPEVAKAAEVARSQMLWLRRHTFDSEVDYENISLLRGQLRTFQSRPPPKSDSDGGECSIILLAERLRQTVEVMAIFNEDAARALAKARGVASACTVDILKAMCLSRTLSPADAYEHYRALRGAGLDAGAVVHDKSYFA